MEYIDFIWLLNSELDYFKFYKTIPTNEAYCFKQQLPGIKNNSSLRTITNTADENPQKCGPYYYRKFQC
jgi:hypothetical protein